MKDREALKELVLPGRMGERFKVLVLGMGEVMRDLAGLSRPWMQAGKAGAAAPLSPARGGAAAGEGEERS